MELGIYETLITNSLQQKLAQLNTHQYYIIDDKKLDAEEASQFLGKHLGAVIMAALNLIKSSKEGPTIVEQQIDITNKILIFLSQEIEQYQFDHDLLDAQGRIFGGRF